MTVKPGVPLSAVDVEVFLGGVLVDPTDIRYTIKTPAGPVAIDEDGLTVAAVSGLRTGLGRYGAGRTVLPDAAPSGTYTIDWSIKKLPTSPTIVRTNSFVVGAGDPVDATQDGTSRRDLPDTTNIVKLRSKIKDNRPDDTRWAFFNSELQGFLDDAMAQHTTGRRIESAATADDLAMALLLAHCAANEALATDRSRFFRWQDGNESVDKTLQPRNLLDACRTILARYNALTRKRFEEDDRGLDQSPAGGIVEFRRR